MTEQKRQEIQQVLGAFKDMGANTFQLIKEKVKLVLSDAYLTEWLEYLWCEDQAEMQENRSQQFPR